MSWATWWIFVGATALIAATPGPNMLHVMSRSVQYGLRPTLFVMAGCLSAVIICVSLSSLGLGAVLATSRLLFEPLRYLGVAYLLWLAFKSWNSPVGEETGVQPADGVDAAKPARLYRTALLTGLSNPKLIIFSAAFFPQFIRPDGNWALQFAILVASFTVIEVSCYFAYALGGRSLARALSSAARRRTFNRATAGLFAIFGIGLLVYRAG